MREQLEFLVARSAMPNVTLQVLRGGSFHAALLLRRTR
ncbi:hypothetical protein [Paractinoplanes atraurantiacus]